MSRTLKIVLAYDGTDLVGWQRQAEGVSVQGLLEEALSAFERRPVAVVGAGRTDAGAHALGQVASCRFEHALAGEALRRALNATLPGDVRVLHVESAADDFHARYSAHAKTYRYLILNADYASPFERRYTWHVTQPLNLGAMAAAASALVGTHDFAAFQGAGSASRTTVRTVARATVASPPFVEVFGTALAVSRRPEDSRLIVFEMTGNGFLRHMVRNAVGSLVEIGSGRREPGWLVEVMAGRDRMQAGPTAPASGLFLVAVEY